MNINFPLILVCLTLVSGIIALIDKLFFEKRRKKTNKEISIIADYARSLFPVFLIVLIIRSFIVQPFRVPTGSLEPTVQPGDFILVNQFSYGLRLPVLHTKILKIGEPHRGDIVVFRYPAYPSVDYVKRVIGLPGDHIVYKNKVLTINGKKMNQKFLRNGIDFEPAQGNMPIQHIPVQIKQEQLNGITHLIQVRQHGSPEAGNYSFVVPKGDYFMMGDNRDNSADSRFWGFVPEKNLIGKAFLVWMSWNGDKHRIEWSRIGTIL